MATALGLTREDVLLGRGEDVNMERLVPLVKRRASGEPVAYILGRQEFWSLDFIVTPDVLVPRGDTETLLDAALKCFDKNAALRILDLGTGSGVLLIAALREWPRARGVGTDISGSALRVASRNAERLGVAARAEFCRADWFDGINDRFDLILSNPPYIAADEVLGPGVREFEPHGALFSGDDGLDVYRHIIPELHSFMRPGGCTILEIGYRQAAEVTALGTSHGLMAQTRYDLAGRARAIEFHTA